MQILSHNPEQVRTLKYSDSVTVQCNHCSELFVCKAQLVQGNLGRGTKKMYCSKKCHGEEYKERLYPIVCERCGKTYNGLTRKRFPHNFCGQTCRKAHQRAVIAALRPPKAPRVLKVKAPPKEKTKTTFAIQPIIHKIEDIPLEGKIFNCSKCGAEILRKRKDIPKSKTGHFYCSKSCRMQHYNSNILTRSSNQRSKAEDILITLIRADFPGLEIKPNDRTALPSKLEMDVHLPSCQLAIELNGPVHYMPIYGEERFEKVKIKDSQKALEIHEAGLGLLVLDVSKLHSAKQQETAIGKFYSDYVKPLIR